MKRDRLLRVSKGLSTVVARWVVVLSLFSLSAYAQGIVIGEATIGAYGTLQITSASAGVAASVVKLGDDMAGTTRLAVNRSFTLDLNGYNLTIEVEQGGGIHLNSGITLTLMDSNPGQNALTVMSGSGAGVNTSRGTLVVESGRVVVKGGEGGAGIGGSAGGAGGNIILLGGTITATGGQQGAGIGGGAGGAGGNISMLGGTVTATGGQQGAGIGGGAGGAGGNISLFGGTVTATGGQQGAGVGGGGGAASGASGNIHIAGAVHITATGGNSETQGGGAGIGSGGAMGEVGRVGDMVMEASEKVVATGGTGVGGRRGANIGFGGSAGEVENAGDEVQPRHTREVETHTITTQVGAGGSIFLWQASPVFDGSNLVVTVTADEGHILHTVLGQTISSQQKWTFVIPEVRGPQTITATFREFGGEGGSNFGPGSGDYGYYEDDIFGCNTSGGPFGVAALGVLAVFVWGRRRRLLC